LPSNLLPTPEQRAEIEKFRIHILTKFPLYIGPESAAKTMAAISKMLMVLASKSSDELAMEAKGEAYMMALEDIQSWAVEEAARKWYRGEYGSEYDYKWMPDPATIRSLAQIEASKMHSALMLAIDLSHAESMDEIDYSNEHRIKMLEKLSSLKLELKSNEIH